MTQTSPGDVKSEGKMVKEVKKVRKRFTHDKTSMRGTWEPQPVLPGPA